jgi:TonB family protein
MQFGRIAPRLALTGVLLVIPVCLFAQNSDVGARLERATALTSAMAIDDRPWHMKLDVTVFDDAGKKPNTGTIEVFKQSKLSREVFTFGASVSTRIDDGTGIYWSSVGDPVPYRATEILEQVLHPGPTADDLNSGKPILVPHKFGKVSLDCIMVTQPIQVMKPIQVTQLIRGLEPMPFGLYPTYCLMPGSDIIHISYNFGTRMVIINTSGLFLNHHVVMQMDIYESNILVATAKSNALTSYTPEPDQFVPTAEMKLSVASVHVAGGVIAGNKIGGITPAYPETARANHVSGSVVLRAVIDRDGQVHALRPMSSPDPDLSLSAIAAVRTWKYKPYLLNGVPTEIDTTIMVNYSIGPYSYIRGR